MSGLDNCLRTAGDVRALVTGLTVLGTGGGGRPEAGLAALQPLVDQGKRVEWIAVDDLNDSDYVCALSGVGSIAPSAVMSIEERTEAGYPNGPLRRPPMLIALETLQRYTGIQVSAVFPMELGGSNAATPLAAAVMAGVPFLNCDCSGRALPEVTQTSVARAGYKLAPAVFADPWGMVAIMDAAPSTKLAERLGKLMSTISKRPDPNTQCARASFLMQAGDLKRACVRGGLTRALNLGRAISAARAAGADAISCAASELGGVIIGRGVVTRREWFSRDGFMSGTTSIRCENGSCAEIWFKNENHIVWLDGVVRCTSPDLIVVLDSKTAEPFTNTMLAEGIGVSIIVAPADRSLVAPDALPLLGPEHYGFDFAYVPARSVS